MKLTMLGIAAMLAAGPVIAQTTNTAPGAAAGSPAVGGPPTTSTRPDTSSGATLGTNNPAVSGVTSTRQESGASQPERGSNSFTEGQAKSRIEDGGFSQVSDLRKDDDGIWRGRGMKSGQSVNVWMDFRGNVGQQ